MTPFQIRACDSAIQQDTTDYLPSKDRVTRWDIAGFVFSIITHLVDVGLDINVAYRYYVDNPNQYYYVLTLIFILVPAVINTAFSIKMYCQNKEDTQMKPLTKRFTKRRLCYLIILLFQLAPVLRYFDALRYAIKSKKAEKEKNIENQRKYYKLMIQEDSDVALLRVLECYLEAAPQQILQLAIIFYKHGDGNTLTIVHQLLSIGSSFVSMAWSMASYHRLLRVALINKNNISWGGTIMQFMWHFLVTVSRIMCISVIASIFPYYTVLVLSVHWFVMVIWLKITSDQPAICGNNKVFEYFFFAVFGTVYIFTHISLSQGRTLVRYVFFYTILCVENIIAMIIWMLYSDEVIRSSPYYLPIICLNFITFFVGIVFMIVYYKICHPSTGYIQRHLVKR
nr:XK-related protein 6-like [Onthophagus taurus]